MTVTVPGFKAATYSSVQVVVGQTYMLKAVMQPGDVTSSVTVEAGAQVLETTESSVGLTVTGPAITHVPTASNSALYGLALMSPDLQTIGGPRQSSADGLPGGAVNITFDGIPAQWQSGKSGDPVFAQVYPNIDDVSEFTIVSAANSANDTGEGAVQLKFVSQRGTNQYHGGGWEYFRNDYLNANYYFNNLAGLPRQKMRYDQVGGKIGGPILKNKLFFFVDLSVWVRPQGVSRTRTILTPAASSGMYTYAPTTMPSGSLPSWVTCNNGAGTCTANLLQMAQASGGNGQIDKIVGQSLAAMQQAVTAPGVHLLAPPSYYQQQLTFNNSGAYTQHMPDVRLDWNPKPNHSFEADYHLTRLELNPDVLNSDDYTYPVAPFSSNQAGYYADRQIWAWAWRWNLSPNKSNELRFGFQTSPESFVPDLNSSVYPVITTNLGSLPIQPSFPSLVSNPYLIASPSRDNYAVAQLSDNLVWSHGNHNMALGFSLSRQRSGTANYSPSYGRVTLGMAATDPATAYFTGTNLPGMSATDVTTAESLYAFLTGRISAYSGSVALNPDTRQFQTGRYQSNHYHQSDLGIYATDSWRIRPNLTLNYGLRWQYEGVPVDDLNQYYAVQGGLAGLYGISGVGNLFKPGVMTGSIPQFVLDNGKPWYNNWYGGFSPNFGFAWQPSASSGVGHTILGKNGATVIRGGYSIAYDREGLSGWVALANPGYTGSQFATPVAPGTALIPGEFAAGSLQLQNLNIQSLSQTPGTFGGSFGINTAASQSVNVADPNLHMPYVQSWSLGVQRSLDANTVIEARYVGNHGVALWERENLNEVNIFENGFLNEFNLAQQNLNICQQNSAACIASQANSGVAAGSQTASNFADWGLPGQSPLPVFTASFTGTNTSGARTSSQSNSNFRSATFLTPIASGQAGSVASTLSGLTYWQNILTAGYPRNFWVVNPDATGGAFYLHNGFQSTYNALVVDVRRRLKRGLTFDANYTWEHSITDDWQRNGNNSTESIVTIRNQSLNRGPSPYDIRGAFKIFATYELPIGSGHRAAFQNAIANTVISGWQFNSMNRWQTGRPMLITGGLGGTINQNDGGVMMNGITASQLQSELGVYKTTSPAPGAVWYAPQSLLGANGQGVNPQMLAACSTPGQYCNRLFLYGPSFFEADWSLQKTTKIREKISLELRLEAVNVFNNANFLWGTQGASFFSTASQSLQSKTFGRITTAYQDLDTTDSPGGRMLQLVARFNF